MNTRAIQRFVSFATILLVVLFLTGSGDHKKKTPYSIDGTYELIWLSEGGDIPAGTKITEEFHGDGTFTERYDAGGAVLTSPGEYWMEAPDVIEFTAGTTWMGFMKHLIKRPRERIMELYFLLPQGVGDRSHVLKLL